MSAKELRHKDVWNGEYKGIYYEVINWGKNMEYKPEGTWNYYIYLNVEDFPKKYHKHLWLREGRSYYDCIFGGEVYWHGGCTYYEKWSNSPKQVKFGCDFAHSWDDGQEYDLESVAHYARKTIDEIVKYRE